MRRRVANLLLLFVTLALLDWLLGRILGGTEHAILYDPSGGASGCCGQLRPNTATRYTGWFLRIPPVPQEVNALGYRGQPRPQEKLGTALRIAAVGDSYTYGLGVGVDDSIPAQLERALNSGLGRPAEVLNFGVPGAQLPDTIERVGCFVTRWHPDIVVYFMYADDLESPLCEWKNVARLGERLARGDFHALASDWHTALQLAGGLASWKSSLVRASQLSYLMLSRWSTAVDDDSWRTPLTANLRALAEAAEAGGAQLLVVALGDPSAYRRSPLLGHILEGQRIRWLDGRDWLFGPSELRLPIIPRDGHLNSEGNRNAAQRVAAWLINSGALAAR